MNYANQLKDIFSTILNQEITSYNITAKLRDSIMDVHIQKYVSFCPNSNDAIFHYALNIKENHKSNIFLPYFSAFNDGKWDKDDFRERISLLSPKFTAQDFADKPEISDLLSSYSYLLIKVTCANDNSPNLSFYGVEDSIKASLNSNSPNYILKNQLPNICNELTWGDLIKSEDSFILRFYNMLYGGNKEFYLGVKSLDRDIEGHSLSTIIAHTNDLASLLEFYKNRDTTIRLFRIVNAVRAKYVEVFNALSKIESIKSAKAAIMSRNMSHNLGSHVMFYIKQKLQSVSKIVNNNVLHNIIPGNLEDINIKTITDKIAANKDVELPFLVGLGRFINYLQERQDYIATVATNYIPARSTISFKDFIYDELKPDLRYERHKRNDSSSDNGWQPKNLLLDYIAYSEGYSKSDAIEIKFGEFDGHNPLDVTAETDFQALRKFNVAVPGGVIGRQAIFSIVENIIRNAAKHSEHRPDGKLVLQLSLVDADKDFTGDFLTDKFRCMRKEKGSMESGESLVKLYQNHKDAFHILRIKLDMPNKKEDIEALVGKLGEDYVEEDGSMKETSKGLKEMRISAAWLRGHSIDTAIPTTEPPVLAVYSEPYKDDKDKETISYYLCIPKPCKVAFVVDKELLTYRDDNGKESSYLDLNPMLEPFGCAVFGYDDEAKQLNKKEQNDKEQGKENKYQISDIADYEIVCMLLDDDNDKKRDSIVPYISSRYIPDSATTKSILDELERIAKPSKGSDQEGKNNETQYAQIKTAIDSIYEKWLETAYPKAKNTKLVIADMRDGDSSRKDNSVLASDQNVLLTTTGNVTLDDCKDSVVYSTHFKGLAPDGNYEKMLSNAACIDSVTGNNSTDRLIRQDEWTKEWKSKHLSAGLAKVAIFDERIFSTFITNEPIITKEKVKSIIENNHEDPAQALCDLYKHTRKDEIGYDQADEIINDPKCIDNVIPAIKNAIYTHDTAQKNHERRIWAFDISIVENENENSVDIEGYKVSIGDQVQPYIKRTTDAKVTVANIMYDKENKKVILRDHGVLSTSGSKMFDYISIHQGILDKIYGVFGIKNNDAAKLEVTKAIHSCFSKYDTPNDAKDFLPRFIIHSGRSKPNEKDMPQHQPFVQFAAIDHAVKDCKYTLVELLATAHYESNNNN